MKPIALVLLLIAESPTDQHVEQAAPVAALPAEQCHEAAQALNAGFAASAGDAFAFCTEE